MAALGRSRATSLEVLWISGHTLNQYNDSELVSLADLATARSDWCPISLIPLPPRSTWSPKWFSLIHLLQPGYRSQEPRAVIYIGKYKQSKWQQSHLWRSRNVSVRIMKESKASWRYDQGCGCLGLLGKGRLSLLWGPSAFRKQYRCMKTSAACCCHPEVKTLQQMPAFTAMLCIDPAVTYVEAGGKFSRLSPSPSESFK